MVGTYFRFLFLMGLSLTWGWVGGGLQAAWADTSGAVEGILVLRNGNVLAGKLLRMKDHYQVELPHGQLRVPADQVELTCRSLDEAYEQRRRSRTGSTADSHLELARWCLRHQILEHAARELREARSIDPHHGTLMLLERRLQQARRLSERKSVEKPIANQKASPIATTIGVRSQPLAKVQALREMAPHAKSAFVRQIQPILLRSCAASGCHQSGSSRPMELNHFAMEGAGNPRAMLGNLEAVLVQSRQETSGEIALLRFARTAHGTDGDHLSKPLSARQLELLGAWLLEAEARSSGSSESSEPLLLKETRSVSANRVDLFDPEIFNRRYGKQGEVIKDR